MNLGDMENSVLVTLQQPGAQNLPAAPAWNLLTNPQFSQGVVDFYLNRGYERVLSDLYILDLSLVTATFPSIASTGLYPISPPVTSPVTTALAGAITVTGAQAVTPASMTNVTLGTTLFVENEIVVVTAIAATTFTATFSSTHPAAAVVRGVKWPKSRQVRRAYYSPQGLGYTQEYRPGGDLVPWDEFQKYTDHGFLTATSFATQPGKMSVTPDRTKLAMFSGPAQAGDIITVQYAPFASVGADVCPVLAAATDTPLLPEDAHEAIVHYALGWLWLRLREAGMSQMSKTMYSEEIARLRNQYADRFAGDSMRFEDLGGAGVGVLGSVGGLSGMP